MNAIFYFIHVHVYALKQIVEKKFCVRYLQIKDHEVMPRALFAVYSIFTELNRIQPTSKEVQSYPKEKTRSHWIFGYYTRKQASGRKDGWIDR